MLRNYITIAIRHFLRDSRTTLINVTGLSVGITAFFLIMLWLNLQLSFNDMHENRDRIFRVMADRSQDTRVSIAPSTPYPLGEALRQQAGIEYVTRMMRQHNILLSSDNYKQEQAIHLVDNDFLNIFSFPLISSRVPDALKDPYSIVLTESAYDRFFGDMPLTGQRMKMKAWGDEFDLTVTAIIQDPPQNSSLKFEFLVPIELMLRSQEWLGSWGTASLDTYVQLREGYDDQLISEEIKDIPGQNYSWVYEIYLFPFTKVHLYNVFKDRAGSGRIIYVYIFSAAAFLILFLACINFMNLSTAQAARRAREMGIRKTMGALAGTIRKQVFVEGVILACFSAFIAVSFIQLILPFYNDLMGVSFETHWISGGHLLFLLCIAILTGLFSAWYPALVYARFNPVSVLKSNFSSATRLHWSKQALLVFQLVISVMMICASVIIYRQVEYLNNSDLGFRKDNLFYFNVHQGGAYEKNEQVARELKAHPDVQEVTFLSENPLQVYQTSGDPVWEGKDPGIAYPPFSFFDTDYDVERVLNLQILQGRAFDREIASDSTGFLINEKAAAIIGPDAIGKKMEFWDREGEIIGIFKDFHHLSMHNEIHPMILRHWRGNTSMVFVRVNGDIPGVLAHAKEVYEGYEKDYPFSYQFLDDQFSKLYTAERQVQVLTILFAFLVILIAVLGLYGIVAYVLQGQHKMIGIRKAMGATTSQMIRMFLRRFSRWVIYAVFIALPASYFLLSGWLENFAYRIQISVIDFIVVVGFIMFITMITVLSQVVQAAATNPAVSLKSE